MPTHSPSAPRTCIPAALDASSFENVEAHFAELLGRPVNSQPEFDQWLIDRSELDAACSETQANLYITMTCATDDEAAQKAYADYIEAVVPRLKPVSFDLDRRLVELSSRFASPRHAILVRDTKADVDLYRQENVPIETELAKLSQAYDQLIGAMTVQFEGQERTLPQLAVFQERTDRDLRERAFRAGVERRLRDKDAIEGLFDHMVTLRHSVATNAGFQGFGDYAFKAKHRFDYTPRHCFDFHESCERLIVPMLRRQEERRRRALGVDTLRPWDLVVDVKGRGPLRPFDGGADLMRRTVATFRLLDPRLATMIGSLGTGSEARGSRDGAGLDLDSRKGKAPGGYQYMRDRSRKPFIFMNAANTSRDVTTMVHEAGHAFHSMLTVDEPLLAYRHAPMEFCEVASMSMELLTLPHMNTRESFYADDADYQRAKRQQIERSVSLLPWIAMIDAFQHWIYANPTHRREDRRTHWLSLDQRFGSSCSWQGLDDARAYLWHRQPHLFSVPFYYIEYGIAQLGALQLWLLSLEKGERTAIDFYLKALSLGGTRTLPELFEACGLRFDFGSETIQRLADRAEQELDRLPE